MRRWQGSPGGSCESLQSVQSVQPKEVATVQCGPQGHFGFKGMVTGGAYGGSVVVKSAQMDCVVLHVSQWQQLLSIVHRIHWVDQLATWPLFATLNAIQLRTLNDNLHYVQFPAGESSSAVHCTLHPRAFIPHPRKNELRAAISR